MAIHETIKEGGAGRSTCPAHIDGLARPFLPWAIMALVMLAHPAAAQQTEDRFSGFYIGTHIGHVGTDATSFTSAPYTANFPTENVPVPGRNDKLDFESGLLGFHTGFNMVTSGNVLLGVETDWTRLNAENVIPGGNTIEVNGEDFILSHRSQAELDWQASLRARLGYVAGNALFFGTIGAALLRTQWEERAVAVDTDNDITFIQNHSKSDTLTGLAVGGGAEYAFSNRFVLGVDYLYENFGGLGSLPFGHATPPQQGSIGDLDIHKVRARLSVMFGGQ